MKFEFPRRSTWRVAALVLMTLVHSRAEAQEPPPTDPLAPFERLIGGEWHLDQSYQVFEWGIGKRSVVGRSFVLSEGKPTLVGEGFWFYHPGEGEIRGYFVATGMGIDLFDYRTSFEGDEMISALTTYGQMSGEFEEIWSFIGDQTFEWSLYQKTPDGPSKLMGGTYVRR